MHTRHPVPCVALALVFFSLAGCGRGSLADGSVLVDTFAPADDARSSSKQQDAGTPDTKLPRAVRVLFIGNSYTSTNSLPKVLESLARAKQSPVRFTTAHHTPGGATWENHDVNPAVTQLIGQGWDYVVLQDQSQQPGVITDVKKAFLSLDSKIRKTGARTVLFMTWARKLAPPSAFVWNASISRYYEVHAQQVGAIVAPVGRAWERALRDAAVVLHASDGSHPGTKGTLLAAYVFYATLTGESPVGLGTGGLSVSSQEAGKLQKVAAATIAARRPPALPLIGSWPLTASATGNDLIPGPGVTLGDTAGPGALPKSATRFGNGKTAIAVVPGPPPRTLKVSFHAHRADWNKPTTAGSEYLLTGPAFTIRHSAHSLYFHISPVGSAPAPAAMTHDARKLGSGWHHFMMSHDGATWSVQIDGALVGSKKVSGRLDRLDSWNVIRLGNKFGLLSLDGGWLIQKRA